MRLIETTVHCNAQLFLIMIDIEGKEDYHFPSGTVLSISDFLIPIYQVESAQSYYVGSYYPPQPWLCYRWIFHQLYSNPRKVFLNLAYTYLNIFAKYLPKLVNFVKRNYYCKILRYKALRCVDFRDTQLLFGSKSYSPAVTHDKIYDFCIL